VQHQHRRGVVVTIDVDVQRDRTVVDCSGTGYHLPSARGAFRFVDGEDVTAFR
jgi:hypothetical protein